MFSMLWQSIKWLYDILIIHGLNSLLGVLPPYAFQLVVLGVIFLAAKILPSIIEFIIKVFNWCLNVFER